MTSTNGNGQVKPDDRRAPGRNATTFDSARGKAAVAERERKRVERITIAREEIEAGLLQAARLVREAMTSAKKKDAADWQIRLKAALDLLDRGLGQAVKPIEVSRLGDMEAKAEEWARSRLAQAN